MKVIVVYKQTETTMCKECPICMEPLFDNADTKIMRLKKKILVKRGEKLPIVKLKCGHTFHKKCIKNWFVKTEVESSTKCPMCRDKIRFKPDSRDFMMHKIRYDDPDYEYGDECLYDIDTDSEYSDDSNDSDDSNNLESYRFRFPIFPINTDDEYDEYDDEDYDDDEDYIIEIDPDNTRTLVDYSDLYDETSIV